MIHCSYSFVCFNNKFGCGCSSLVNHSICSIIEYRYTLSKIITYDDFKVGICIYAIFYHAIHAYKV